MSANIETAVLADLPHEEGVVSIYESAGQVFPKIRSIHFTPDIHCAAKRAVEDGGIREPVFSFDVHPGGAWDFTRIRCEVSGEIRTGTGSSEDRRSRRAHKGRL